MTEPLHAAMRVRKKLRQAAVAGMLPKSASRSLLAGEIPQPHIFAQKPVEEALKAAAEALPTRSFKTSQPSTLMWKISSRKEY
jgi:hypothetical protein